MWVCFAIAQQLSAILGHHLVERRNSALLRTRKNRTDRKLRTSTRDLGLINAKLREFFSRSANARHVNTHLLRRISGTNRNLTIDRRIISRRRTLPHLRVVLNSSRLISRPINMKLRQTKVSNIQSVTNLKLLHRRRERARTLNCRYNGNSTTNLCYRRPIRPNILGPTIGLIHRLNRRHRVRLIVSGVIRPRCVTQNSFAILTSTVLRRLRNSSSRRGEGTGVQRL